MSRKALILALLLIAGAPAAPPVPHIVAGRCAETDPARVEPSLRALFDHQPETRAALVLVDGCPLLKAYEPGYSDANRFISWSMAKTITAMLVGALVRDGRLSLDAPAPIAEWQRPGDPRAAITLRMLLQMRSGLRHVEVGDPVEQSDTNQTLFVAHPAAMAAAAIAHPLAHRPGDRFEYSSLTTIILAEIVTRALTPSRDPHVRATAYRDFAEARLLRPAGIASALFEFDGAGTQVGGSLIHMTLDDWGRAGLLLLDGRGVGGRQVVDPAWLAFMKTPSPANPEYGGQTWLNRPVGGGGRATLFPDKGMPDAAAMLGHLGQYVVATPAPGTKRGIVVVRLGHTAENKLHPVARAVGDAAAAATGAVARWAASRAIAVGSVSTRTSAIRTPSP